LPGINSFYPWQKPIMPAQESFLLGNKSLFPQSGVLVSMKTIVDAVDFNHLTSSA
jgi:hypothetical protein